MRRSSVWGKNKVCRQMRVESLSGSRVCQPLTVELPEDLEWGIVNVRVVVGGWSGKGMKEEAQAKRWQGLQT